MMCEDVEIGVYSNLNIIYFNFDIAELKDNAMQFKQ